MTSTKTCSSLKAVPATAGATTAKRPGKTTDLILHLVAQAYAMGNDSLPRVRLTMGTGIKPKTVTNTLPKLKAQGLVTYTAKEVSLTPAGIKEAGDSARRPTSNAEYHERLKEDLNKRQREIFDKLATGEIWDKDKLAVELGYDSAKHKTFVNHIGSLSGKNIIEYPEKGLVRMSDACFVVRN